MLFCGIGFTVVSLSGKEPCTKGPMRPWSPKTLGSECRTVLLLVTNRATGRWSTTLPTRGWFAAAICGCYLVGELKKGRYVYYHCTGNKGKCDEPYTREEAMHQQFTAILKTLAIPETVLKWLDHELTYSTEQDERIKQRTIKSWQDDWDRLQGRLDVMYEDKLDGRITSEQFDRKSKETRSNSRRCEPKSASIKPRKRISARATI